MTKTELTEGEALVLNQPAPRNRVVMTMGDKGGVGKTTFAVGLADYYQANEIDVQLLDLDTENKSRGSLDHFYRGQTRKVNIHTAAGLDCFIDCLTGESRLLLADMGAGASQVADQWFDSMYEDVSDLGV